MSQYILTYSGSRQQKKKKTDVPINSFVIRNLKLKNFQVEWGVFVIKYEYHAHDYIIKICSYP